MDIIDALYVGSQKSRPDIMRPKNDNFQNLWAHVC